MRTSQKIILSVSLIAEIHKIRKDGLPIIVTNGCFDILHSGHVHYLEAGHSLLGDWDNSFLLVGINSDRSIQQLKGPDRPVNSQYDRCRVLAALECVDGVCMFNRVKATDFLKAVRPDVYFKGGDYTLEKLDPEEREALESMGTKIKFVPLVPEKSTSDTIAKIRLTCR